MTAKQGRYLKQYIEYKETYAPRAAQTYYLPLERFLDKVNIDIDQISFSDIVEYQKTLLDQYAPKSVQFYLSVIKDYFKYLIEEGETIKFSLSRIKVKKVREKRPVSVEFEEFFALLCVTDKENEIQWMVQQLIVRFLFDTGVRISELLDLDYRQFNPDNRFVEIKSKKSHELRVIVWSEATHNILQRYLDIRPSLNNSPALFVALHSKGHYTNRMTPETVGRTLKRLCRKAQIRHLTPHSFRHGKAYDILDKGGTLRDVQGALGHAKITTTQIYSRWRENELRDRLMSFI